MSHRTCCATAVNTLRATRDIRQVALWLGHASTQSTEIYLEADPTQKIEALGATKAPGLRPGKFQPPDQLIAELRRSTLCGARVQEPGRKGAPGAPAR